MHFPGRSVYHSPLRSSKTRLVSLSCIVFMMLLGIFASQAPAQTASFTPAWVQQSPSSSPSVRELASMVYDAATGQVVLFGGDGDSFLNDTWTWNGTTWVQQSPSSSPSVRELASMAYDAATGQVVLFGGDDSNFDPLNDTWTWNGTTWVQQSPSSSPSARDGASMVYDAATGQVVLFGGDGSNYDFLNDTWTQQLGGVNVGTANVCSSGAPTPCSTSATLTFTFSGTSGTIKAPVVLTQGATGLDFTDAGTGTCTTQGTSYSYASGSTCTVVVTFAPKIPGVRMGAVELLNSSGTVIATELVSGTGTGPQVTFSPGAISTAAGNGTGGYVASQDTGTTAATNAELYAPSGMAVDGAGNLYIADLGNNRIRKVTAATGDISTVAGNGAAGYVASQDTGTTAATSAELNEPEGVAVDGAGNLYIADLENNRIRKVTASTGYISTVAGNGTGGYVASQDTGTTAATSAELCYPEGVAVDVAGNLYIADACNNRIRKVTASTGYISTVAGNGTYGYSGDGAAATSAELSFPTGVAVDVAGNLYIADRNNNRIRKVTAATGDISTVAGNGAAGYVASQDTGATAATSAELFNPTGVAVDGAGNLYIADFGNSRIRKVTATAAPLSFASTPVGATSSDSPQTVIVNNIGNSLLTFANPTTGGNPSIAAGFSIGNSSTCPQLTQNSSAGTLASGASCTDLISFTPVDSGNVSGSLTTTDNTLNVTGSTQAVSLSGTATADAFTVTGVSPNSGTSAGGTSVTITGTGLSNVTSVMFGGVASTSFTVVSSTQITAVSPAGSAGTVDIIVGSATDVSEPTSADQFTYLRAVTFGTMSFSPASSETVGTSQAITISEAVTYGGAQPTGAVTFVLNGVTYTATCTTAGSPETCTATVPAATIAALPVAGYTVTAALAQDSAYSAGSGTSGTFTITPPYFVLASFTGTTGATPGANPGYGNLIQASDGNFYGLTVRGGANNGGAAFKMTPAGVVTLLHSFAFAGAADGEYPQGSLVQGTDGNFYGLTELGGANNEGAAFKMTPTGTVTLLHNFAGAADGQSPWGSLVQGTDGNFYGLTSGGGAHGGGTAFKMTPAGAVTLLHSFGGASDGAIPYGSLVQGTDGNFYGLTYGLPGLGGANNEGAAFKMTPTGLVTLLHSFAGAAYGGHPVGSLVQGMDGNFYGLTSEGGANNGGAAFKMTPAGAVTLLHSFGGASDGAIPYGSLVQGTDGNFYGLTLQGDANSDGVAFQMTPAGVVTLLHTFVGGMADGLNPYGSLLQGLDGNFYGMTYQGGSSNDGVIFKQTTGSTLAAPVALSSSATTVYTGGAFTLTYSVANAYTGTTNGTNAGSSSLGYCFASNTAGNATWTGVIAGSPTAASSSSLTASSTAGTYTYSLTCGGMESNLVTLTVQTPPPPVITVPSNMTVEATGAAGAVATYTATATDAVDGTDPVTCVPASGSTFALGTTQVTCSSTDAHGNKSTKSFTVTVQDTTPPVITVPANITTAATSAAGAVATYTATATDAVDGSITPSCMPASGSTFAFGTTTVNCTATDSAHNTSTASFNVTVTPIEPVGTASGTLTATVTITTAGTTSAALGTAIQVVTQGATGLDFAYITGGTCAVSTAYTVGQTCTVYYTFTPQYPGQRLGAVSLTNSSGTTLGTSLISGTGTGPLATTDSNTAYVTYAAISGTPTEAAFDGSGTLWVNDYNNLLHKVTTGGAVTSTSYTGINNPYGIAIDGAGYLYIAQQSGGTVIKVNPSTYASTVFASGFTTPEGVAFDSAGNLYVGDTGANVIYQVTPSGTKTTYITATTASSPNELAVDATGTVYWTSRSNNTVYKATTSNLTPTLVTDNVVLNQPLALQVDAAGNLYVSNGAGTTGVYEFNAAGTLIASFPDGGNGEVSGVALDASGNLYAVPYNAQAAFKITRTSGAALSFGSVAVGAASAAQNMELENDGNSPLTIASIGSSSTNFTFAGAVNGSTAGCGTTLASAGVCNLAATFTPQTVGSSLSANGVVTDNSLNATGSTQTVSLSGTGMAGTATFGTMSFSPAATEPQGTSQAITISDSVTYGSAQPTGAVTFVLNGVTYTATCTTVGSPETCSATVPAATIAALPGNTYSVTAALASDSTYSAATGTSGSFNISAQTPTLTVSSPSIVYGTSSTTLTATVPYTGSTAPTGAVTFILNGTNYNASCSTASNTRTCTATANTGSLTVTSYTIAASEAADSNYVHASGSGTLTVSVSQVTASISASNKTYNASTAATIASCTLTGVLAADSGNVSCIASNANFATKNAGTGIAATANVSLSGSAAGNYALSSSVASTTADITAAPLTITAGSNSKPYDGTTSAAAVPTLGTGQLQGSDTVTGLAEVYPTPSVGTGKTLNVSAYTVNDGNSGNNYAVTTVPNTTGVITSAVLNLIANNATKVYGSANPTFTGSVTGQQNGDTFTESFSTLATASSAVGSYTITPSVTGANLADYTQSVTTGTLSITQATPTISLASSVSSVLVQNPVTLTATVGSAVSTPTGNVTFLDGSTPLGTVQLTAGAASLTTSSLAPGTHAIVAVYLGDSNFISVTSRTANVQASDFSLTPVLTSQTILPGGTVNYGFTVSPVGATALPTGVALSVSGLPAGSTYSFNPSPTIASGSGATNLTLTITLPQQKAMLHQPSRLLPFSLATLLLLPFAGRLRHRARKFSRLCAMLLLLIGTAAGMTMLSGCGRENGFLVQPQQSYTVTVAATGGALTHSATVTLSVE